MQLTVARSRFLPALRQLDLWPACAFESIQLCSISKPLLIIRLKSLPNCKIYHVFHTNK